MKKISLDTEKKLLPRLRYMGILLILGSLFCLTYAIIIDPALTQLEIEKIENVIAEAESAEEELFVEYSELLNLYLIATTFGIIGSLCLFGFTRKKKEFEALNETSPKAPEETGA